MTYTLPLPPFWLNFVPAPRCDFTGDKIVDGPYTIHSQWPIGLVLRVPVNVCAVLTLPNGRQQTFIQGDYRLDVPPGPYTVHYVNCQRQQLELDPVNASCADAWEATLKVAVIWQVGEATALLVTEKPLAAFRTSCLASVKAFIQSMLHDELVGTPIQPPLLAQVLADRLLQSMRTSCVCEGLQLIEVLVLDRQGDSRRTKVIQETSVETTQLAQAQIIQRAQAELTTARLQQDIQLAEQRKALAIKEAEIVRRKAEEAELIRLRKAEIAAREAEMLRPVQLQAIEMQQRAEVQQLQHAQMIRALEARERILGQLAATVLQIQTTPGLQRGGADNAEALGAALKAISQSIPAIPAASFPPARLNGHAASPPSLRERVVAELGAVIALPGASCEPLQVIAPDEVQVVIHYMGCRFTIVCGANHPHEPPRQILVREGEQLDVPVPNLAWADGMGLRDIILQANARTMPRPADDWPSPDQPDYPESLAA